MAKRSSPKQLAHRPGAAQGTTHAALPKEDRLADIATDPSKLTMENIEAAFAAAATTPKDRGKKLEPSETCKQSCLNVARAYIAYQRQDLQIARGEGVWPWEGMPHIDFAKQARILKKMIQEFGRYWQTVAPPQEIDVGPHGEWAQAIIDYRTGLATAAAAAAGLSGFVEGIEPSPTTRPWKRLKAFQVWVLHTWHFWNEAGLEATAGREGSALDYRDGPFSRFLWTLCNDMPVDVRPKAATNRKTFGNAVEQALRATRKRPPE